MLSLGTDLVEVGQIRAALTRHPGLRDRLFTESEWEYAQRHRDPIPHLAARFAAKEAVMKSLGCGLGSMSFTEIEILRAASGQPFISLVGRAASVAHESGVTRFELSLTHTPTMAHAMVAAL